MCFTWKRVSGGLGREVYHKVETGGRTQVRQMAKASLKKKKEFTFTFLSERLQSAEAESMEYNLSLHLPYQLCSRH